LTFSPQPLPPKIYLIPRGIFILFEKYLKLYKSTVFFIGKRTARVSLFFFSFFFFLQDWNWMRVMPRSFRQTQLILIFSHHQLPFFFFFLQDGGQLTDLALRLGPLYHPAVLVYQPSLRSDANRAIFQSGSSMTSSGRRSGFPYNLPLIYLITGHSHTMWCAISSSSSSLVWLDVIPIAWVTI